MEIVYGKSGRGFGVIEFQDAYGETAQIQDSSNSAPHIWFGCKEPNARILVPSQGWVSYNLAPGTVVSTRMHLSQSQVYDLLPILVHFAEKGRLPEPDALCSTLKIVETALGDRLPLHKALIAAGQQLANAAHALKQDDRLDANLKQSMAELQKNWDDAFSAWFRAPSVPKEKDGTS